MTTNKHGLSRDIPSPVRRKVRQRCGFGCVMCGGALYDYDHFDPEFSDAREHDPNKIALLCPDHHRMRRTGALAENDYRRAIADSYSAQRGWSGTNWAVSSVLPEILLGQTCFQVGQTVLRIGGELILGFELPEVAGAPPRLTCRIFDRTGTLVLSIIENEIRGEADAFDIDATGATWTVRSALRRVDLEVRFDPPTRVTIERLHLEYGRWRLVVEDGRFEPHFDGQPTVLLGGASFISGPGPFLDLPGDEARLEMRGFTFDGSRPPAPIGSIATPTGFILQYPVYALVDGDDRLRIIELGGQSVLAIYLQRSLADSQLGDEDAAVALDQEAFARHLRLIRDRGHADQVSFNLGLEPITVGLDISDVLDLVRQVR